IHSLSDEDWFGFGLASPGGAGDYVKITFDHAQGDVDLELYNDSATVLLDYSAGVGDVEQISLKGLPVGNYRLRILGYKAANPNYTLNIQAPVASFGDWSEPNNSSAAAFDLRQVKGLQVFDPLSLHVAGDEDWFRFTTVTNALRGTYAEIQFNHHL